MKNKVLIYGRFLLAAAILLLFGLAFWSKLYPLKIFDLQFVSALQSGLISGWGLSLILLAMLVIMTLLFGRIYCSTLCPLGIYQELLTILFKPFYKKRRMQPQKHYAFAYFSAAILFGLLCGGTVFLLRMLDPYAVAGNAVSGAWFGLGFLVALTFLVFFKKRFFCTNICPVGALLGLISRFSPFKIRIDTEKCNRCGLCAKTCPCGSINLTNQAVDNETCVKCLKCLGHCRQSALFYGLSKAPQVAFSAKRRQFITAGLTLAVFGVALKSGMELSKFVAAKIKNAVLPAGAGKAEDFANRCLNCNLCVQICPQKIIEPATVDMPFVHLNYGENYCKFNCRKCSEVCPSGAILRISLKQKQNTKIANAVVHEDVCIKCGLCAAECPKHAVIKENGEFPIIRFEKCIGCGKCASVCPVKAIMIEPAKEQVVLN